MEFYRNFSNCFLWLSLFQFPTGWNSTLDGNFANHDRIQFQFPTGWNSTITFCLIENKYWSFNSQRDGILLKFAPKRHIKTLVSIPNGMEFYSTSNKVFFIAKEFQFPTGWNSTLEKRKTIPIHYWFQFPTGWNSTLRMAVLGLFETSFNSQRDGILLPFPPAL